MRLSTDFSTIDVILLPAETSRQSRHPSCRRERADQFDCPAHAPAGVLRVSGFGLESGHLQSYAEVKPVQHARDTRTGQAGTADAPPAANMPTGVMMALDPKVALDIKPSSQ